MTTPTQYSLLMAFHIVCRAKFAFTDTYWSHLESSLDGLDSPPKRQWMQYGILWYYCQSAHRSRLFRLRISSSPSRQISNWVKSSAIASAMNSPMYSFRAGVFARDELKYWNQKSTAIRKRQQHPNTEGKTHMCNELYSLIHCVGRAKCNIRRFGKHRPSTSTMRTRVSMQLLLLSANDDQTASISRKQKTKRHFYDLTYIDAIKHTLRSHVILSIFLLLPFFVFFANKTDCIILVVSKMFASYSFYFQFGQSTGTCFVWNEAARYCMCNALKRMLAHKIELFFFYTYVNR